MQGWSTRRHNVTLEGSMSETCWQTLRAAAVCLRSAGKPCGWQPFCFCAGQPQANLPMGLQNLLATTVDSRGKGGKSANVRRLSAWFGLG